MGAVELPAIDIEEDIPLSDAHAVALVHSELAGVLLEASIALVARSFGAFEGDLTTVRVAVGGDACSVLVADDKIDLLENLPHSVVGRDGLAVVEG